MQKGSITLLLIVLVNFVSLGQDTDYSDRYWKWKKQYSEDCIKNLKDGALLIRLFTRSSSIHLYEDNGQYNVAERIALDQFVENRRLMDAFLNKFNFCKVYFFFSDDTKQVLAGEPGFYLNEKMKIDTSIVRTEDFFMVAEIGELIERPLIINGDTTKVLQASGHILDRTLKMQDSTLLIMPEPFPHYVNALMEKQTEKQVEKLNRKLQDYYSRVR